MPKGEAFVLVGHRHWGKSRTLEALSALSHGRPQKRTITIKSRHFFIRRTSNDDPLNPPPNSFTNFVEKLKPQSDRYLIVTLCPDFTDSLRKTKAILQDLARKYELFFFVLRCKHGSDKEISDDEIKRLKGFGEVELFPTKNAQAKVRAKAFKEFIASRL